MSETNGKLHNPKTPGPNARLIEGLNWSEYKELLLNATALRTQIFQQLLDPRRDIEKECGYPPLGSLITPQMYGELYDRDAIGRRVVEVLPKESFQTNPTVYETDQDCETEFEKAWDALGAQLEETAGNALLSENEEADGGYYQDEEGSIIWDYLLRADIASGIGSYGVIFLGLDDGETNLREPVKPKPGMKLNFIRVFPEELAQITAYETNVSSPRYGFPTYYNLSINDLRNQTSGVAVGAPMTTLNVHWSRCLHVVDNRGTSEIFGTPRQKPVWNNLLGLRKLYGGSPEMFWRGAYPGLSIETNPQAMGDVDIDIPDTKSQLEQYTNGLQRMLLLVGMQAKTLSPTVSDPTSHIKSQLEAICITLGIPMRIFLGSERGELASSQDDAAWNDRIKLRQKKYLIPRLIVPFVSRCIQLGILPKPKNGFRVQWADITSQSDSEKATVATSETQAISTYASAAQKPIYEILTPKDFLVEILKKDEDTAQKMLDNAEEYAAEQEEKQAAQNPIGGQEGLPSELAGLLGGMGGGIMNGNEGVIPKGPSTPQPKATMAKAPVANVEIEIMGPDPYYRLLDLTFNTEQESLQFAQQVYQADPIGVSSFIKNVNEKGCNQYTGPDCDGTNSSQETNTPKEKWSVVGSLKKLLGFGKSQQEIEAEAAMQSIGQPHKPGELPSFQAKLTSALQKPVKRVIQGHGLPVVEVDGKEYIIKQGDRYSPSEHLASHLGQLIGLNIGKVETTTIQGNKVNAVEHSPSEYTTISKLPKEEQAKAVNSVPKEELEKHALYTYLIGHSDPNDGNFLVTPKGQMMSIDKDPSLSDRQGVDQSGRFIFPSYLRFVGGENFTFSQKEINGMLTAGEKIVTELNKMGKTRDAQGVTTRMNVLKESLRLHNNAPTLRDLVILGSAWDIQHKIPNPYGIFYNRK